MRSDDPAVALRACEALLNRAWGTPIAEPERKGSVGATWRDGLTPEELERLREAETEAAAAWDEDEEDEEEAEGAPLATGA